LLEKGVAEVGGEDCTFVVDFIRNVMVKDVDLFLGYVNEGSTLLVDISLLVKNIW
jgi:hypothetical protein